MEWVNIKPCDNEFTSFACQNETLWISNSFACLWFAAPR